MSTSQLLLSTIIIFIIYKTVLSFKRGNLSRNFTSVWLLLWSAVLFFIFEQNTLIKVAHFLGISRGVDLVIYLAVIITFYLIYKIFSTLNQINQKITEIIREIAVENPKKTDTKQKKA